MAVEFLHCCICPRQPDFSDTSHLLTHVSSKGHLSHLHKLQVRSHQEVAAGYQLTIYNEWYLKYGIAQLLSERMQHKESKRVKRRADKQRGRKSVVEEQDSKVDPSLMTTKLESLLEQVDHAQRYLPEYNGRQDQDLVAGRQFGCQPHEFAENSDIPPAPPTPDVAKLKGIIWPGMDIFDSADQETQRKRNQRKDGSILGKMQAMSFMIEPTESVHSPGGTFRKKRHIDDIEEDSPVEGEYPVMKHSSRRRKPLSAVDKNTTRTGPGRAKRATMLQASTTPNRRIHRMTRPSLCDQPTPDGVANTATAKFWHDGSDSDYQWGDFAMFSDASSDLGNTCSTALLPNPFLESARVYTQPDSSTPIDTLWLQPSPHDDGSRGFLRDHKATPLLYAEASMDKDNFNPLRWGRAPKTTPADPMPNALGPYDEHSDDVGSLADVYAFTRNPLANINSSQRMLPVTPQNRLPNPS